MIENQDELRSTLDENRELKERIEQLLASGSEPDVPQSEWDVHLEELQTDEYCMLSATTTLSLLDESGEQLQVATPPTSRSVRPTSVQLTAA